MMHKKALFLEAGALEFWLCDNEGVMAFYAASGVLENSRLMPGFPKSILLD
jgi:hypothetical protein